LMRMMTRYSAWVLIGISIWYEWLWLLNILLNYFESYEKQWHPWDA
jgi:hypothetical protein